MARRYQYRSGQSNGIEAVEEEGIKNLENNVHTECCCPTKAAMAVERCVKTPGRMRCSGPAEERLWYQFESESEV